MSDSLSLYTQQCTDVEAMRNQLLTFNRNDPNAARKAIQNVTILRVYHQLSSIVRYTEMIDKLMDRTYQSIDAKLMNSDPDDDGLWYTLIPMVEKLQTIMISSHKLLEPYLNMEQLTALEVPSEEDPANSFTTMLLDQTSREKVRTGVQQLMEVINTFDTTVTEKETSAVKSKAEEALANLKASQEGNNG